MLTQAIRAYTLTELNVFAAAGDMSLFLCIPRMSLGKDVMHLLKIHPGFGGGVTEDGSELE